MTNHMKALVKARAEEGLWMERVPVPEPGPQEVLIKVRTSAICGTDVHIWKWDENQKDWLLRTPLSDTSNVEDYISWEGNI